MRIIFLFKNVLFLLFSVYANYQTRQAAQPQQESSTQQIIQQPATGRGPRVIYTQPIPDAPQLHTRRISQQPIQHTQQQLQHSQRTIQQQPVQHGQQLQHSQGAAPQQVRATVTALKVFRGYDSEFLRGGHFHIGQVGYVPTFRVSIFSKNSRAGFKILVRISEQAFQLPMICQDRSNLLWLDFSRTRMSFS